MYIVRYLDRFDGAIRIGVRDEREVSALGVVDLGDLWSRSGEEIAELLAHPNGPVRSVYDVEFLAPIDGRTEVWAAGVTYERSRSAREEESSVGGVYDLVYAADRPELFFKSVAWRVVTDGDPVGIRADSALNVPEAELALVINSSAEIVGYTICNDMSSRTIEGDNPLYLPQAKLYAGSCALGAGIRPAAEVTDPGNLGIRLAVARGGSIAWRASTSTAALYRRLDELVDWLFRAQSFPAGVILSSGTGLVPDMDFTLFPGDEVRIDIDQVGSLVNLVQAGREPFAWLDAAGAGGADPP